MVLPERVRDAEVVIGMEVAAAVENATVALLRRKKGAVFKTVDECVEGTLRSSHERGGVCFGGLHLPVRPTYARRSAGFA